MRPADSRPFCGVPIAVKDLLGATEGMPTTNGSAAFGDWVAGHDTAHIRRLREAGAIVVGKTTTPELGLRPVTESLRYGITRNPRDTSLSAGGSSGGSAAAVAAGMVWLAEGSDLGGWIRIPASCCGVVGLKPSVAACRSDRIRRRRRRRRGGRPDRTHPRDVAIALDAMAGYEPGDHIWLDPPAVAYAESIGRPTGPVPIRLATTAPLGVPVDDEPRAGRRARGRGAARPRPPRRAGRSGLG